MKNSMILSLFATILLIGCSSETTEPTKTIQEIQAEKGLPVETLRAQTKTMRKTLRAGGTVEGIQQTYLSNALPGTLNRISVSVGSEVQKDGLIATMQFDEGSPLTVAQSAFVYASESLNRIEKLHKEGAVSRGEVEKVRAEYEHVRRQLGQARVAQFIRAPFAGTVMEILRSEGTKIDEKTPVILLADLSEVLIDLRVHDNAINQYAPGQKAYIETVAGDTLWGVVERTALSAHALTHGFRVTVRFPNSERLLRPGMHRQVYVITEESTEALVIPREAVVRENGEFFVYVDRNGTARKTRVTPGIEAGRDLEIKSGITADDHIVFRGISRLQDGSKINRTNR